MRATAEPVEGNRVRLSVEMDEPEVDRALDGVVKTLARQARVPGFRPGKVPRRVLEARMGGASALRAEALREALPDFYAQAVLDAAVDPIAPPEIDITGGEEQGPLSFDAVVQVRPRVAIPGYDGLQVTVPSPQAAEADVDAQVDRLRESDGELVEVDRPAVDGDHVTIDIHGDDAGQEVLTRDDLLYRVGSGSVVPELDDQLRGARPGDVLAFSAEPAGMPTIAFRVLVKDVKQMKLPEATDEWAAEASEFATLAELRDDLRGRVARVKVLQAQMALRENALAALVDLVDDAEVPDVLVDEELRQRVHDLGHRLEEQRVTLDQFLAATGRSGDELLAELRTDAFRGVKADLALRALADAVPVEVTEEELDEEITAMAGRAGIESGEARARLDRAGRTAAIRSEQRKVKALAWLLDHVEIVDDDGNTVSRDDLRIETPDQQEASDGTTEGDGPGGDEVTSSAGGQPSAEIPTDETAVDETPADTTSEEAGR